jgi:hypothetical protein
MAAPPTRPEGLAYKQASPLKRAARSGNSNWAGGFALIGAAGGDKAYTDETLPSGSPSATYQITAIRSGIRGLPAQFTVNFGVGGGGGFAITGITEDAVMGAKLAA